MYFDGGSAPNPGPSHVCVVIEDKSFLLEIGYGTNNYAEWVALCWGMMIAIDMGIKEIEIIGDSTLVVNQANGAWKIKKQEFLPLKKEFDLLRKSFDKLVLRFEPRAFNLAGKQIEIFLKNR